MTLNTEHSLSGVFHTEASISFIMFAWFIAFGVGAEMVENRICEVDLLIYSFLALYNLIVLFYRIWNFVIYLLKTYLSYFRNA